MSGDVVYAYVGYKPCGCVMGMCVDEPAYRRDTAKFTADLIRRGCRVERVTVEEARRVTLRCEGHLRVVGDGE